MIRKLALICIKHCPYSNLRRLLWKTLFGYDIHPTAKVGRCFINVKELCIEEGAVLRSGNLISCQRFFMAEHSRINGGNVFRGSGNFSLGAYSRVINNHFFDLTANVTIGERSWVAGMNSQFWTHGSFKSPSGQIKEKSINIGNNIYLGSGVKIGPGVSVAPGVVVGLGAVVLKSVKEKDSLWLGNPAVKVKDQIDWRNNWA